MKRFRPDEEFARELLSRALGGSVIINDDGSKPGMFDISAKGPSYGPFAIEVVRAVDEAYVSTYKPIETPTKFSGLIRGYWLGVPVGFNLRRVRAELHNLLVTIDRAEPEDSIITVHDHGNAFTHEMERLGIRTIQSSRFHEPGEVGFWPEFTALFPGNDRPDLSPWLRTFLTEHDDIMAKLRIAPAAERHVFIIVDAFSGSTPEIRDYMLVHPNKAPHDLRGLPAPLTGVWLVSSHGTHLSFWDGQSWRLFNFSGNQTDYLCAN